MAGRPDSTSFPVHSSFSVPVTISNWTSDITLNDITITGITSGIGLNVTTSTTTSGKGNIALHNVKSNNNTGHGAFLSNIAGNGNITIDSVSNDGSSGSSEFSGNTEDGLSAFSNGDITLTDVTADDNQNQPYDGAYLDNSSGSGTISVNNSTFDDNTGGDGLTILSNGDITLTGVTRMTTMTMASIWITLPVPAISALTTHLAVTSAEITSMVSKPIPMGMSPH